MRGDKGTILLATLWILAILSLLAIGIGFRTSIELKLADYQISGIKAREAAKAGIIKAINELEKQEGAGKVADTIWQCGVSLKIDETQESKFKDIRVGEGQFEVSYLDENGTKIYGIEDIQGKININTAPLDVLKRLSPEITDEIANNIRAWRGDNNIPDTAAGVNYSDKAYVCKYAPFNIIEELLLVKDFEPGIFYGDVKEGVIEEGIDKCVTVYGPKEGLKVNINTAGKKILEALGLGDSAQKVVSFRTGNDGDIMKKDDNNVFVDVKGVEEFLKSAPGGGFDDIPLANLHLGQVLVFNSNYFRIRSIGALERKSAKITKTITCVVQREIKSAPPHKVEIIGWVEE